MSEVAARGSASRGGRGSVRGGRGGYSSRGGRGGSTKTPKSASAAFEDQGEIGQLKSKYADSVKMVKEIFPQFTDEDVVVALEENGGDLETTINKITSGAVSQWEDATKKKDKLKTSKPNESGDAAHTFSKGGRGRGGSENARGSRGKAGERGRGAGRGGKHATTTSNTKANTTATSDAAWEVGNPQAAAAEGTGAWGNDTTSSSTPATWDVAGSTESAKAAVPAPAAAPEPQEANKKANGTRSWADIMKPAPKPKPAPVEKPAPVPVPVPQIEEPPVPQELPAEPVIDLKVATPPVPELEEQVPPTTSPSLPPSEPAVNIAPSEDKLTEENLEQVKDMSHPIATDTVASTIGTEDPRSLVATPLQGQTTKQPIGGFATTALKATQGSSRNSSFHRKLKEQSEAVVMPGNHAVDRAAVQFGSLGLGGIADEFDDDREEAETRAQPPQHSPIAPRASLPSAPQASVPVEAAPTPRPAPGLSITETVQAQVPVQAQVSQSEAPQAPQAPSSYDQFSNRFGGLPAATQAPGTTSVTKPYEPFGQQLAGTVSHPLESYGSQSQAPGQQSHNAPSYLGGFGGNDYGSYDYQRNQMYGGFGQQPNQSTLASTGAQRVPSAFGSTAAETPSQYASSHAQQNRFSSSGDALNSGHSTPAPGTGAQSTQQQSHAHSHQLGGHGQAASGHGPYGSYYGGAAYNNTFYNQQMNNPSHHQPYGRDRPAFDDARRYEDSSSYMGQSHHYGYGGYGNYSGGPYAGKYGGPNQYGISPQTSYDGHSASPANAFGRDSGPAGFSNYGRSGSAHPESAQQGQHGASSAYGAMADPFGRNSSAFGTQSSQQQSQQSGGDDSSRYDTDSGKLPPGGPSPAPNQQRPGSATNTAQSGPGNQPQNQGYAGYPHSGLGGFGGHQAGAGGHHASYGNYGGGFSGPYYGSGRGNTWGYGAS